VATSRAGSSPAFGTIFIFLLTVSATY